MKAKTTLSEKRASERTFPGYYGEGSELRLRGFAKRRAKESGRKTKSF